MESLLSFAVVGGVGWGGGRSERFPGQVWNVGGGGVPGAFGTETSEAGSLLPPEKWKSRSGVTPLTFLETHSENP